MASFQHLKYKEITEALAKGAELTWSTFVEDGIIIITVQNWPLTSIGHGNRSVMFGIDTLKCRFSAVVAVIYVSASVAIVQ